MRRLLLSCTAVLALGGAPAAATAQAAGEVRLLGYLQAMELPQRGFMLWEVSAAGALPQGSVADVPIPLRAATEYTFIPICDLDCTDLDLRLLDPSGAEITRTSDMDDPASISVTPRVAGLYRLRVIMASCSTAPCAYAVGMYRMTRPAPPP